MTDMQTENPGNFQYLVSLRARGIEPMIVNGRLALRAIRDGAVVTEKIKQIVKQNKISLLDEMLVEARFAGWRTEEIEVLLYRDGYARIHSSVLHGETIILARDEAAKAALPAELANIVVYTMEEAGKLVQSKRDAATPVDWAETLRTIHAVKRELGGKVTK